MNLHSFQNKFRSRRQGTETETEEENPTSRYEDEDSESLDYDPTAQLSKLISTRKVYHQEATSQQPSVPSNRKSPQYTTPAKFTASSLSKRQSQKAPPINLNLDNRRIKTQMDETFNSEERQIQTHRNAQLESPSFANKGNLTERKYSDSRPEFNRSVPYEIKITPPKSPANNEGLDALSSRSENQNMVFSKRNGKNQEKEHTPPKSEADFPELSLYNQSVSKPRSQIYKATPTPPRPELRPGFVSNPPIRVSYSPLKPSETLQSEAEALVASYRRDQRKFIDAMFPANLSIIFNNRMRTELTRASAGNEDIRFERVHKIYSKYTVRLMHACDPSTLIAGKYTSPNMLSALYLLTEQPRRIVNIFHNQELSNEGIYYLNVCKDGVWRFITIDDFLPVRIGKKKHLLFAHNRVGEDSCEIWPGIIEKCVAKIYGTYEDIVLTKNQGVKNIFRLLTGCPYSEYSLVSIRLKQYISIIDAAIKSKYVVVLEKARSDNSDLLRQLNLNQSLSYQVTSVDSRNIRLRNYADEQASSNLEVSYSLDELGSIFERLLILKEEEGYFYASRTCRHKIGYFSLLEIEIEEPTQVYVDVWQMNSVYFKAHLGSMVEYSHSPYTVNITPEESNSADQTLTIRESGKKCKLAPGRYRVWAHLCQKREYDFTVSFYSDKEIRSIARIKNLEAWRESCC